MKYTKPIHVLVISPFFYPHIGGSQRYMEELYAHLIKKHSNLNVTVLTYNTDNMPVKENYRGLSIVRIPCVQIVRDQFALANPFNLIAALIKLKLTPIDIVHTHIRFFDSSWWAWAYARLIGAKSIFTEHVAAHPTHKNSLIRTVAYLIDNTIGSLAVNQYNLITTTNLAAKKFLEKTGVTKPISILYGGVDTAYFKPNRTKNRTTTVTFAGRIIWSKGITYFLSGIKSLRSFLLQHNCQVIIAGDGDYSSFVNQFVEKHGLEKLIKVTGALKSEEMKKLLQKTDIFVHPSHHNEGFPNVVLEAAASGCFVIATDNAGTKEIIQNQKTGLIIEQKNIQAITNSLLWAIRNEKKRKELAKAGRLFVKHSFDWKIVAESFFCRRLLPLPFLMLGLINRR